MSDWIGVTERLPEPTNDFCGTEFSDDVIVVDKYGSMHVDRVRYPHGIFGHPTKPEFSKNGYGKDSDKITHWMQLPEPPETKND